MNISRNSFVHARDQQLLKAHHNNNSYVAVARFSSIFDHKKGGTTPDKLSSKDSTIEGSEGGYGGSGISDLQGLHGGPGTPSRHDNKATPPTSNRRDETETSDDDERYDNLEDAARDTAGSMAEMAKSGVVGAVETGLKLGDMAKKTMDTMYHAAKKTTESVRDSMADDRRMKDRSKGL